MCANGTVVPPAVLFPGVRFNLEYSIGSPQNFYLGFTQNGWMDTKQFYAWIANHFVKKIPPLRPIVLLIDRHGSHINYYVSQFCAEDQILVIDHVLCNRQTENFLEQNLQCNIQAFQLQNDSSVSFSPERMKYHAKWKH